MEKKDIDQHVFICVACGSVFVLNTGHPKVQNGDWMPVLKEDKDCYTGIVSEYLVCPSCKCCMFRPDVLQRNKDG